MSMIYGGTTITFPDASVQDTAAKNPDWNATTGIAQILNKPTIPAAQVNSDWNALSGVAQILNKPTIPAAQVNSDWNATSGVAQILNRPNNLVDTNTRQVVSNKAVFAIVEQSSEVTPVTDTLTVDISAVSVFTASLSGATNLVLTGLSSVLLSNGQIVSFAVLTTQISATNYINSITAAAGITLNVRWQGGVAPSAGGATGFNLYQFSVLRTASDTYTVLANISGY